MTAHAVDPSIARALYALLNTHHVGRAQAATGAVLALELAGAGYPVSHPRRVGEAVAFLVEQGIPACAASDCGYWLAASPEEIEASLAEVEQRARHSLRRRRLLRMTLRKMLGQRSIQGVA